MKADPSNPHGVARGQIWERTRQGVSHQIHVLDVVGGRALVRGNRSSWINTKTGFDCMELVYDPATAPPRLDLYQDCEGCAHALLIHGAGRPGECRKASCGCDAWVGPLRYRDPVSGEAIDPTR